MLWSMDSRQCGWAGRMRVPWEGGRQMFVGEGLAKATSTSTSRGNDDGDESFLGVGAWGWEVTT